MAKDDLNGYELEGEHIESAPEVLDAAKNGGKAWIHPVGETKVTKSGDKATATTEAVKVDLSDTVRVVELPDGTKQVLDGENVPSIQNGVSVGEYARVEGVKTVEEYKRSDRLRTALAIAGTALIILITTLGLRGCGEKGVQQGDLNPDNPSISTMVDELNPEQIEEIIAILNENNCSYEMIDELLDPANVVRIAQDAYEATDYDLELMGSDLCEYSEIQQTVVEPGAVFVEEVMAFKQKYAGRELDAESRQAMMAEAIPLLEKQGKWVSVAVGLVEKHAETTQECVDLGIRGEGYVTEGKVTAGQLEELRDKGAKISSFLQQYQASQKQAEGIRDGSISCDIKGNVLTMFDANGQMSMTYLNEEQISRLSETNSKSR